jgi:hypothetical protein
MLTTRCAFCSFGRPAQPRRHAPSSRLMRATGRGQSQRRDGEGGLFELDIVASPGVPGAGLTDSPGPGSSLR